MTTAIVVGSGPNGLAAALVLARAGVRVTVYERAATPGGGMRSAELMESGVLHDICSAVHPMAVASPFFRRAGLDDPALCPQPVRFAAPEVDLAHPLPDGSAGVLYRDIDRTAAGLGRDGRMWRATFGPFARHFDALLEDVLGPALHLPRHPLLFGAFGANAALPATVHWQRFRTPQARALFAGVAAHVFTRLDTPLSSSVGQLLTTAAHARGWPVAIGGTQAIADAMIASLTLWGGRVECGVDVTSIHDLADADIVLLDTSPRVAAGILGPALPTRQRRAYGRFAHGPAAAKVDFVIDGPVPWANSAARSAGTVHLGGTAEAVAAAEKSCDRGDLPPAPFVLVGQQFLADPSRSHGSHHPLWAYAHVPADWQATPQQVTELVTRQIERYAPGFRDTIVSSLAMPPQAMEDYNPNYIGGDIIGGYSGLRQLLARPTATDPYRTGVPGVYLCSASTPPGAGVHGMCGALAAERALADLDGQRADLSPRRPGRRR